MSIALDLYIKLLDAPDNDTKFRAIADALEQLEQKLEARQRALDEAARPMPKEPKEPNEPRESKEPKQE